MTEKKLPQAGEWWKTRDGERVYVTTVLPEWCLTSFPVIGLRNTYGDSTEEYTREGFYACAAQPNMNDLVERLLWCKSFDDTEPVVEVWPKYYRAEAGQAFIRRDSRIAAVYVYRDGRETSFGEWDDFDDNRKQFTESEALARLTPRCPDCGELAGDGHADVCPMAWVTQDRVPPREEYDQRRWVPPFSNKPSEWGVGIGLWSLRHGDKNANGTLEVRCRRKDLPPLPEPVKETRRISLRVFVPRRVLDDQSTDWPIRVTRGEIRDVATWVEVHGLSVYVEAAE